MEKIKVKQLLINNENMRVPGLKDLDMPSKQNEIIQAHITFSSNSEDEYYDMSKSIYDLKDITSNLIVLKLEDGSDKYVVHEGNRRLIGIKSILDPSINKKYSKELNKLKESSKSLWPGLSENFEVVCYVAETLGAAKEAAKLTNVDNKNGAAKNEWEIYSINYYQNDLNETNRFLKLLIDKCGYKVRDFEEMNMPYQSFKEIFKNQILRSYNLDYEDDVTIEFAKNLIKKLKQNKTSEKYLRVNEVRKNSLAIHKMIEDTANSLGIKTEKLKHKKKIKKSLKKSKSVLFPNKELNSKKFDKLPQCKSKILYLELLNIKFSEVSLYTSVAMSRILLEDLLDSNLEPLDLKKSLSDKFNIFYIKHRDSFQATEKNLFDKYKKENGSSKLEELNGYVHNHNFVTTIEIAKPLYLDIVKIIHKIIDIT